MDTEDSHKKYTLEELKKACAVWQTDEPYSVIGLPITVLLEYLFTYKNNRDHILARVATINRDEALFIQLHDKEERYCHVELPESTPNVGQVWPIKDWRSHYEKVVLDRQRSEQSRKNKELLEKARLVMANAILSDPDIGGLFDAERAMVMVAGIIRDKRYDKAKKFGCENLKELLK